MTRHDLRLVPAAIATWCVAALASARAPVAFAAWGLVGVGVLGAAACALSAGVRRRIAAGLGLALVVASAASLVGHARLSAEEPVTARTGDTVALEGTVVREPRPVGPDAFTGEPRAAVEVEVSWLEAGSAGADDLGAGDRDLVSAGSGAGRAVRARVVVIASGAWLDVRLGEVLGFEGELAPAGAGRVAALVWDPSITSRAASTGLWSAVDGIREQFRATAAALPDDRRALVTGMVIGDTRDMSATQAEAMRVVGLTHLTAVSGSHFSVVALAVGAALRALRWPRVIRAVVLTVAMSSFAMLVLPDPSVVRALTMALVVAAALSWGRPAQAMPALAAGTVVLLAWDPHLALEIGYGLSVTAVSAIVVLAPVLARGLARLVTVPVATAIAVPLAAQLACAPLLVLLAPQVGLYAVPANLVAAVSAMPVTLLGLAAVVLGGLGLPGAHALTALASWCALPVSRAAEGFAALPGARLAWPPGAVGVAVMALVGAAIALGVAGLGRVRAAPGAWWWVAAGGFVAAAALAVPVVRAAAGPGAPAHWTIVSCDVGQGDMTLIRAGAASAIVVDTGPAGGAGAACLTRFSVTQVPLLVLTHPHADHDGAVSELAVVADIAEAWISSAGSVAQARELTSLGIEAAIPAAGARVAAGQASLTVLPSAGTAGGGVDITGDSAVNDASIVLLAGSGPVTALLLGDLEAQGQRDLAMVLGPRIVDAIKVAHHGSASQSPELLSLVSARVALVSVGEGNAYGHPAAAALELYGSAATDVLRTDECGDIALTWDAALGIDSSCPSAMAG